MNTLLLPGSRDNEINKLFKYFDTLENFIFQNKLKWKIFIPTLPHLIKKIRAKTSTWHTETLITADSKVIDNNYNKFL